jgi:D-alanyl-D-alanine dipeptidase
MLPFLKPLLLSLVLFANLHDDMRLKPLPAELRPGPTALDYHIIPIDLTSAQNKEELVDLRSYAIAGEQYYSRADGLNPPYYKAICLHDHGALLCRKTVADKLKQVNAQLNPYGVELYVYDSYRPIECQRSLWSYFVKVAKEKAGQYCSDPSVFNGKDFRTWPTHTTGGAVDLTLRSLSNQQVLYMGTVFDEASPASYTSTFEQSSDEDNSASVIEARRNRRLLYWAMHSQGFANYPYEWWHYDYGTQMWAKNSNQFGHPQSKAFYGLPAPVISRTHPKSYTKHLPER